MFYSLPTETKLDIFKCLSYKELRSIKQTNLYFYAFVNNFEGKLARKKLFKIYIGDIDTFKVIPHKLLKPRNKNFDFPLNERLEEKFKNGLEKPISLYLPDTDLNKNMGICLSNRVYGTEYFLQPPRIIKSKEDIKIAYYYLNKLFKRYFQHGWFNDFIFNPELIQLLFGNSKQFYAQHYSLSFTDDNLENIFKFASNHLLGGTLSTNFLLSKDMKKSKDISFKILTSGGDNFEEVYLGFDSSPEGLEQYINVQMIYDYIVEYIATAEDCSKMVSFISLNYNLSFPSPKISERATNIKIKQLENSTTTKYEIANIYNPKVRFSFCHEFYYVDIRKME
uniref:Uncharacterized protein n=1 Tax=Meloidogyne enterolobii TaxID=390850 RepID=A0A6V7VZS6_MELEN|nr:unnamed protein product [Meloidogyne enterolobii]